MVTCPCFLDVEDTQLVTVLVTQAVYNVSYPALLLNILLVFSRMY